MKNKKALSAVVATVIIILLTMAAITIVWTFVKKVVNENKDQVDSCFNVETGEKVTLNELYTCYNEDSVQVSLNIADVEVDAVVISIMVGGNSKVVTLTNVERTYDDIKYYNNEEETQITLPGKNEGKTYIISGFSGTINKVDWIRIAPVVNTNQCGITSQINDIPNCALLG